MCRYCASKERELRAIQSELNDAYIMLENRDKEIRMLKIERSKHTSVSNIQEIKKTIEEYEEQMKDAKLSGNFPLWQYLDMKKEKLEQWIK